MNIAEATKEALEKGLGITRASWRFNNEVICLIPTNTTLCCVMYGVCLEAKSPRWNPSADDLIADDWEVSH